MYSCYMIPRPCASILRRMYYMPDKRLTHPIPTAFIVACLVSFRSLFVHREQSSGAARRAAAVQRRPSHYNPYPSGSSRTPQGSGNGSRGDLGRIRGRIKLFQDSVLDTCRTLEGVLDDDGTTLVEISQRSQLGPVAEDDPGAVEAQVRHPSPDEYEVQMEQVGGEGEVAAAGASAAPGIVAAEDVPRRWGTVSTARLSLDSLYQQETRSISPETAESLQQRRSIVISEPSPLTLNPVYPPWRRGSPDEAERGEAEKIRDIRRDD